MLEKLTDIFALNDAAIRDDYQLLTAGRTSAPLPSYVQKVGEDIFLEPGAKVQPGTVLNASSGDRKSTRLNSSHVRIPYAVFCLKKKTLHRLRARSGIPTAAGWTPITVRRL